MEILFACVVIGAAAVATFIEPMRRAILALWIAGLALGALFLYQGSEFLALLQWLIASLLTISFMFFVVMFGEFDTVQDSPPGTLFEKLRWVVPSILGLGFAWLIASTVQLIPIHEEIRPDLMAIGQCLIDEYFLAFEILGLFLLLVLVGAGVTARPFVGQKDVR